MIKNTYSAAQLLYKPVFVYNLRPLVTFRLRWTDVVKELLRFLVHIEVGNMDPGVGDLAGIQRELVHGEPN